MTSVTRWDATDAENGAKKIESSTIYNIAGSPISQTTPWDGTSTRTVSIGYADAWNDSVSRTTYAYPTTITDPASNSSTVLYRYDIGANVSATSPTPSGQSYGKTTKRVYDEFGRLERNSVYVNTTEQAYTKYVYHANGAQRNVFSTLVDADIDGLDADDEVETETQFDGAGRVRRSRTEHPGSAGGWSGALTEYDILGRVKRQSVPTEVDGSWEPDGDDSTFLWNTQEYDWMGRTTRTIPTDSTGSDGKDTLITYPGCGCAGGLVTTVEGPLVPRDDTPETDARRKQKSYADILGRTFKTETFEWNGSTVYSADLHTFNGRDQITQTRQYAGTTASGTYQDTTATFDGHGRMASRHLPQQIEEEEDPLSTVYNYNPDGSIVSVTDARGAVTNYTYNARGLVINIGWTVPGGSGISDPHDVDLAYDDAGNRLTMEDALGTVNYAYDSLSRLTSETREIEELTASFTLSYQYQIGGQLKQITDPDGVAIDYGFDATGRLSAVTGSGNYYSSVSNYASGFAYRAWGAVKEYDYANSTGATISYNNRLLPSEIEITGIKANTSATPHTEGGEYTYNADGRPKYGTDIRTSGLHDRAFAFDHQGRMVDGYSGTEARNFAGLTASTTVDGAFRHSFGYDSFGNETGVIT